MWDGYTTSIVLGAVDAWKTLWRKIDILQHNYYESRTDVGKNMGIEYSVEITE